MTVNSTQDKWGVPPQTIGWTVSTNQVEGNVVAIDADFKPGYYINSSGRTIYFSPDLVGETLGTGGSLQVISSSYKKAYVPYNSQWTAVGSFTGQDTPYGLSNFYVNQSVYTASFGVNSDIGISTNGGASWARYGTPLGGYNSQHWYGDGVYIGSCDGYGTQRIMTSTNPAGGPTSWSTRTGVALGQRIYDMVYWTGATHKWNAMMGATYLFTSADGYTWTSRPSPVSYTNCIWQAGSYLYTGYQQNLYYSANGVTWTQCTMPINHAGGQINGVGYGNGVYLAVGNVFVTGTAVCNGIYKSSDGITWTTAGILGNNVESNVNGAFSGAVYNATSGRFLVVTTGQSYTTTDAVTWYRSGGLQSNAPRNGADRQDSVYKSSSNSRSLALYVDGGQFVHAQPRTSTISWVYKSTSGRGLYSSGKQEGILTYFGKFSDPGVPTTSVY